MDPRVGDSVDVPGGERSNSWVLYKGRRELSVAYSWPQNLPLGARTAEMWTGMELRRQLNSISRSKQANHVRELGDHTSKPPSLALAYSYLSKKRVGEALLRRKHRH